MDVLRLTRYCFAISSVLEFLCALAPAFLKISTPNIRREMMICIRLQLEQGLTQSKSQSQLLPADTPTLTVPVRQMNAACTHFRSIQACRAHACAVHCMDHLYSSTLSDNEQISLATKSVENMQAVRPYITARVLRTSAGSRASGSLTLFFEPSCA